MPLIVLLFALACGHATPAPSPPPSGRRVAQGPPPPRAAPANDVARTAAQASDEAHALLMEEGELLWKRWTTGSGPLPASALAEHPRLAQRETIDLVEAASAPGRTPQARAACAKASASSGRGSKPA